MHILMKKEKNKIAQKLFMPNPRRDRIADCLVLEFESLTMFE